jgi:hypothetical protein
MSAIEAIHKGGTTTRTFEVEVNIQGTSPAVAYFHEAFGPVAQYGHFPFTQMVMQDKKKHTLSMIGREHEHGQYDPRVALQLTHLNPPAS